MLHDITEQRKVQPQLLEQQRALATLNERERLARELHDSLGQDLAATHLQASAAMAWAVNAFSNEVTAMPIPMVAKHSAQMMKACARSIAVLEALIFLLKDTLNAFET
jgi:glucose-6-phosphate-specific signal transduction histidine kinase